MQFPISRDYWISAGFDQLRPLDDPHRKHGGIDIAVPHGTPIVSPESGLLAYHMRIRTNTEAYHNAVYWPGAATTYALRNYFYDWAGGVVIVYGNSGMTHVFLHLDGVEVFRRLVEARDTRIFQEHADKDGRYYLWANMLHRPVVHPGDCIAVSGRAGTMKGDHVHYEIHRGKQWIRHRDRPNPEQIFSEAITA